MNVILLGKRVLADIIKKFEMRPFCLYGWILNPMTKTHREGQMEKRIRPHEDRGGN